MLLLILSVFICVYLLLNLVFRYGVDLICVRRRLSAAEILVF